MLRNVRDNLLGHAIRATDGVIGETDDLYFDDDDWAIRYLVVDTGKWLPGRRVLISPLAMGHSKPDGMAELAVTLTRAQVQNSPNIDTSKPVSRQHEAEYFGYYGYPPYWGGPGIWGVGAYPGSLTTGRRFCEDPKHPQRRGAPGSVDTHLRSCRAVTGYHLNAQDGDIGHVQDFLVDSRTWTIRYLVVNTSNWWIGHSVLVSPHWIETVNWAERDVSVELTRQTIKDAPAYPAGMELTSEQEQAIYAHYGRTGYWTVPMAEALGTRSPEQGIR